MCARCHAWLDLIVVVALPCADLLCGGEEAQEQQEPPTHAAGMLRALVSLRHS
jgi:hypothetical protein